MRSRVYFPPIIRGGGTTKQLQIYPFGWRDEPDIKPDGNGVSAMIYPDGDD